MGEVIAVVSGKGGTGKTSLCAGLAVALAEAGQRVLCVDCDVGLRNLDISLGLSDRGALSFLEVCRGECTLDQLPEHPLCPGLFFLTAPLNATPDAIDQDLFGDLLRQARAVFDVTLLDAPAGVGSGFRLAARWADRFVLVTGAGPAAIRDAARVGDLLELMGKTNVRLVVNRVDRRMLSTIRVSVDDVMDTAGLPLLGIVPEDPNVTLAAAFGAPLLKLSQRTPAAMSCRRIAGRLLGRYEPIRLR